jgi:hypothetical protein
LAKKPFSFAITIGEQSVSAIMPMRKLLISGPSPLAEPGVGRAAELESHPTRAAPAAAPSTPRN